MAQILSMASRSLIDGAHRAMLFLSISNRPALMFRVHNDREIAKFRREAISLFSVKPTSENARLTIDSGGSR
jgi:hypothetical protein